MLWYGMVYSCILLDELGIHRGHIEFMRKTRKGCFVRFPYKCVLDVYTHQNTLLVLLGTSGPKSREVSSVLKIGPSMV